MSVIGIIPAAGRASRIDGLPKYLLPVKEGYLLRVMCERMTDAGAETILIGANPDNRALVEQYATGNALVYSVDSQTMSETVLAAQRWCGDADIIFGMPDTWWEGGAWPFTQMLLSPFSLDVQVRAAVWQARPEQRDKLGMVAVKKDMLHTREGYTEILQISQIDDKPKNTYLSHAWGAIAWASGFWKCIRPDDPHLGYALVRALSLQMRVQALMQTSNFYDCGCRESYFELVRSLL